MIFLPFLSADVTIKIRSNIFISKHGGDDNGSVLSVQKKLFLYTLKERQGWQIF